MAFAFGGFGWTLSGRSAVGWLVFASRFVLILGVIGALVSWLEGDSAGGLIAALVVGVGSSLASAIWLGRVELVRALRATASADAA